MSDSHFRLAKYLELKDNIPLIEEFQRCGSDKWTLREIRRCELAILTETNFVMKSLTAYDFVYAFLYNFLCEPPEETGLIREVDSVCRILEIAHTSGTTPI